MKRENEKGKKELKGGREKEISRERESMTKSKERKTDRLTRQVGQVNRCAHFNCRYFCSDR